MRLEENQRKGSSQLFPESVAKTVVKSLLFCFSLFFLLNKIIADFSVSPSEVKVIKSFIIQYLFHSSNAVDELEQKLKAYTMSTELQLHINLQIDQI